MTRNSRHRAWLSLATGTALFAIGLTAGAAIVDESGEAVTYEARLARSEAVNTGYKRRARTKSGWLRSKR